MYLTLGFGATEEEQRKRTYDWIFFNLKQKYLNRENKTKEFTNEIINSFKKDFENYQKKIYSEYEKAEKSNPRPERYYHINNGVRMAWDYDTFFIKIDFWHVNSKHPFSPDGIVVMQYNQAFAISTEQLETTINFVNREAKNNRNLPCKIRNRGGKVK